MRKLFYSYLLVIATLWGQNSITLTSGPPQSVTSVTANRVGNQGNSTYYYWVVANWAAGQSPASMTQVSFAPDTLTGSNYIALSWNLVPGAISYDVLRTSTPNLVSCASCAVATGLTTNTRNDTGGALGAYTYSPTGNVTATFTLNNSLYINPTVTENRDFQAPVPLCVGAPGNTLGQTRSFCTTAVGAVYVCTHAGGCTVAGDWTLISGGGGGNVAWVVTNLGNITGAVTLHVGSTAQIFTGTLTGNITFTVADVGSAPFMVDITQNAVSSFTTSWDTSVIGGGNMDPSTTPQARCFQTFYWIGTAGLARSQGAMTCPIGSAGLITGTGVRSIPSGSGALSAPDVSQTTSGDRTSTGKVDNTGSTHTLPIKSGVLASIPATCTQGEMYFVTDAVPGVMVYQCSSTNTWIRGAYSQGTTAGKPATCTLGQIYFATDSLAGQNLYLCTATNTWTQLAGLSGYIDITDSGVQFGTDPMCAGSTVNRSIGAWGWDSAGTISVANSPAAGDAICGYTGTTTAAANAYSYWLLNETSAQAGFPPMNNESRKTEIVFTFTTGSVITEEVMYVGLISNPSGSTTFSDNSGNDIAVTYRNNTGCTAPLPATQTTWQFMNRKADAFPGVLTDSGVTVQASTTYQFRIRLGTPGTVGMNVRKLGTSWLANDITSTNLPTTAMSPSVRVGSCEAVTKSITFKSIRFAQANN